MEEFIRQGEDTEESDEYIYPWEDWIALYSKVKIIKLSQSIPTMKRYIIIIIIVVFISTILKKFNE